MSSLPLELKSLDGLLEKCPNLIFINPNTNYNGDTKPFGYLCEKHADDKVKEAMSQRHFFWNKEKRCYHIDSFLFWAINCNVKYINGNTRSNYGTQENFEVGKNLLLSKYEQKMKMLGWEKNETKKCWEYKLLN
jgi:hypothetical protein